MGLVAERHAIVDRAVNEVCPCCGDFVRSLWELTGWCSSCSIKNGRRCTRCDENQPLENYSKDRTRKDGRRPVCRSCDAAQSRERKARKSHPILPVEQPA